MKTLECVVTKYLPSLLRKGLKPAFSIAIKLSKMVLHIELYCPNPTKRSKFSAQKFNKILNI